MTRVCIFIDGNNLYGGLRDECNRTDLDFGPFIEWLLSERELVRTYYYNSIVPRKIDPERYAKQQRFFDSLSRIQYFQISLGRLEYRDGKLVEKGVDVTLAVDMLTMAYNEAYDTAILVSNDGDFAKVIKAVCDLGKHVEVACFPKAYHVKKAADKVIELNKSSLKNLWQK